MNRTILFALSVTCAFAALPACDEGYETIGVTRGSGFGGGTIYAPTGAGPYGAIAVAPGYLYTQDSISWYGPLLAQAGFVVITIDTKSILDSTSARGEQLLAALDYVSDQSPVRAKVDRTRQAVMGWSRGGGGTLRASVDRPSLKAAITLAPWDTTSDFSASRVPTLTVACEDDAMAPTSEHAYAQYASLGGGTPKSYLEIAGGSHFCVTRRDEDIARAVVRWMEYFVDGDRAAGVCPHVPAGGAVSRSESSCPF